MNELEIVRLEKEKWAGYNLPIEYEVWEYYDVELKGCFDLKLIKKTLSEPMTHKQSNQDYPDILFAPYYENTINYGIIDEKDPSHLLGAIEFFHESWNNRLRITEVFVDSSIRRKGYGTRLVKKAIEHAKTIGARAIVLETQTNNVRAIDFYFANGFKFNGIDLTEYSNIDILAKEVKLELALLIDR